ncbi:hypothetical protein, partial [Accumulibacter sp.]|uniref:hypothetical protein n=1 Tax=Accumulibacter sp. TaxID=2053492 RepID=UPI0028C380C1
MRSSPEPNHHGTACEPHRHRPFQKCDPGREHHPQFCHLLEDNQSAVQVSLSGSAMTFFVMLLRRAEAAFAVVLWGKPISYPTVQIPGARSRDACRLLRQQFDHRLKLLH